MSEGLSRLSAVWCIVGAYLGSSWLFGFFRAVWSSKNDDDLLSIKKRWLVLLVRAPHWDRAVIVCVMVDCKWGGWKETNLPYLLRCSLYCAL